MSSILSLISLDPTQHDAVTRRDADILVTAGAGSGKTRTLVARFLAFVEQGAPLRSLIAITFTDKAAREMRTRIRENIAYWLASEANSERALWESAFAELESARIGTIHGLCAAILRAHPAEAGIDPDFQVLDENAGAACRAQAIDAALTWAANDADATALFALLKENALRDMLTALIEKRLSARAAFAVASEPRDVWETALARAVARYTESPEVRAALTTLRDLHARGELIGNAGNKLAAQIVALLERWTRFENAEDWDARLRELFALRRENLGGSAGSKGAAKDAVKVLRETYDEALDPWLGGKNASDAMPRWQLDLRAADALPQLRRAFDTAIREYDALKAERRALDFDDLEAQTVALLENNADVRVLWQSETRAVLVDEFQDTNDFQRRIVYALSGFQNSPFAIRHSLFVVGDGKQSIYRFRGGDVTVLRRVQADLAASAGAAFNLDLTYRAHKSLVEHLNTLLEPVLGGADDPARPHAIPFSPLRAHRAEPRAGVCAPFVEFCLGVGENAAEARAATASALAARLWRLRDEERIEWGDIALLFRASTHFADYEAAFERANIPFVTVAGKGFYARPEVRDLMNALAAIADPTDDLALAGVLRSPAFALSDGALYLLRRAGETKRSFWAALRGDLTSLAPDDAARAARAREILGRAIQLAGRVSVATTLKFFLDATDYRAMLCLAPDSERPRRNVDKLLADAHTSGLTSIGEFLEYAQTLRDVEAREGEAPVQAGASVQLMTVHKAKGLEFPVVVIADAAHEPRAARSFLLDAELGPVFTVAEAQEHSVIDLIARLSDQDHADAENRRLLYVAATRAKDKLIVCGHGKRKTDGTLTLGGWLDPLGASTGLDTATIPEPLTTPIEIELSAMETSIGCLVSPLIEIENQKHRPERSEEAKIENPISNLQLPVSNFQPLISPIVAPASELADEKMRAREAEPPPRVWRIVPIAQRPRGPAWVIGKLVHEALRRWRFPDRADFHEFLFPHALAAGLTDRLEIGETISEARRLLERFQRHELYAEMNAAKRFHELPYTFQRDGQTETGVIDVLYRAGEVWHVVDFKTDDIRDEEKLKEKIAEYREQVLRYADAVRALVGAMPATQLCFLDVRGEISVVVCGKS
ncbi:MAG: UvrD-helicase domain-containing protein [Chloroflexi bacterium]|nr:UvrD-helicase domain-containing protein [Chloroflexota bacterium]